MKAILFERLHGDHRRYAALLCILDRQLHIAAGEELPDYHLLAGLFRYLTHQPETWHHRVEGRLFERLAERAPEHRRIARYGRELEDRMWRATATPEEALDLNVLNLARAFSELYHHHLHAEDHRVLPRLEAHFPARELDAMDFGVSLESPPESAPDFQRLYRRIATDRTGLRLGHDEQADYCPLCAAGRASQADAQHP